MLNRAWVSCCVVFAFLFHIAGSHDCLGEGNKGPVERRLTLITTAKKKVDFIFSYRSNGEFSGVRIETPSPTPGVTPLITEDVVRSDKNHEIVITSDWSGGGARMIQSIRLTPRPFQAPAGNNEQRTDIFLLPSTGAGKVRLIFNWEGSNLTNLRVEEVRGDPDSVL